MSDAEDFEQQPLTAHLAELRSCLLISLVAVGAGFALTWAFAERLAGWFLRPLLTVLPEGKVMIFISYQAGFFFT